MHESPPSDAIVLRTASRAAADAFCDVIDEWLTRNATKVDTTVVIPTPAQTPRKV